MVQASIIVPTYNRSRFLRAAVDSALAQGEGVEVIVVDDGSTDDTSAILDSYADRILVLRQRNQGPSAARNLGAEQSGGDFLFFLDSDDELETGAIAGLLAKTRDLGTGKVPFGRAVNIDEAGARTTGPAYGFPAFPHGRELQLADLLGGIMPLSLSLIPRDRFHSLGGLRTDLRLGEDHEFAVRAHRSGLRYVASGVPVIRVRKHSGSRLSGTASAEFGRSAVRIWDDIADLSRDASDWNMAAARALARMVWIAGRDTARSGDRSSAETLFKLAKSLDMKADEVSAPALRSLGRLVGPYLAERTAELVKGLWRRV